MLVNRNIIAFLLGVTAAAPAVAQISLAPVVSPRGVTNAFTLAPAPAVVAPGGLIRVDGLNFGTSEDTQVLVNGAPARVVSIASGRILAQVPAGTAPGMAEVVVTRAGASSRAAGIRVQAVSPSVKTQNGQGYGAAAAGIKDGVATAVVGGLGAEPPVVHVGGLPAESSAIPAADRPGETDLVVKLPTEWKPGDVLSVRSGAAVANCTTLDKGQSVAVSFVRLIEGAPEIRSLVTSDLRGHYAIASGAREADGCYKAYLLDLGAGQEKAIDPCLTTASENVLAPAVAESEGAAIAGILGPLGEGRTKVVIFRPERAAPLTVELPASASSLISSVPGSVTALLEGGGAASIDARTGEVRDSPVLTVPPAGIGLAGGLQVDLGDGLNQALSLPVQGRDRETAVLVGNSAENPTLVKLALLAGGAVVESQDFPEGWSALLGPAASLPSRIAPGGAPGGTPGGAPGAGQGTAPRAATRTSLVYHSASGRFLVLAANGSSHGVVGFRAGAAPQIIRFPEGWFAATCTARVPMYTFELSQRFVVAGSSTLETEARSPCPARGMVVIDPEAASASVTALPPQSPFNASGTAGVLNDFVYAGNSESPDTLVVFDGATGAVSALSAPAGISSFSGITAIAAMNSLLASATATSTRDAGFVFFDLERGSSKAFGLPAGFSSATLVGVFPAVRKFVARAVLSGNDGSQLVVYDLLTGQATVVANPEGVAWAGQPAQLQSAAPGTPPGGFPGGFPGGAPGVPPQGADIPVAGQLQRGVENANTKANTVETLGYNTERQPVGIIGIRIP